MYAEIMQVAIAASMMVQTGLMVRNAMRTEQSQSAGALKIAPELKIEPAHARENGAPLATGSAVQETGAIEPMMAGDANPVG